MAESISIEQLKSLMECSICLDKLDTPKLLKCGHQFCKQCLEGIIVFREDGSGVISCPYRCDLQTDITTEQTVNDLQTTYALKGVLDVLEAGKQRLDSWLPICKYSDDCSKYISVYCCGTVMCKTCFLNHEKSKRFHQNKLNLSFNKKECRLKVMCEEHKSDCTHLCMDNKFLCTYCVNRNHDHRDHRKNTVEDDVKFLKESLNNDLHRTENLLQFLKLTEENILSSKTRLDDVLRIRREECLFRYTNLLDKEEGIIRRTFEKMCDTHLNQYPDKQLSSSYHKEMLQKCDVELAIAKEQIMFSISGNRNMSLQCVHVSISDEFDFLSDRPLGYLERTYQEKVEIHPLPVPTLNHNFEAVIKESKRTPVASADHQSQFKQKTKLIRKLAIGDGNPETSSHTMDLLEHFDSVEQDVGEETVEVVFKWLVDRVTAVRSVFLISSNMADNVELKKEVGCYRSAPVTIATGKYNGVLVIDLDILPINDFDVTLLSEVVHLVLNGRSNRALPDEVG